MAADLATLLFALLWGFAGGPSNERAPRMPRRPAPAPPRPEAGVPPPPSPPWPQVIPAGLPAFPGSGWEYDEPPPLPVVQRAGQLVQQLWARGSGASRIEQTAGRWIAYRAEVVRSGKKGVVAYRVKGTARAPSSPPTQARRPPPQLPAPSASRTSSAPPAAPAHAPVIPLHPGGPPVVPRPTLRQGAGMGALEHLSPHVKYVQLVLGVSPVDGDFGPITAAKVDKFQRVNNLKVDKVVGPETWAALDRHPRARAMLQQQARA